jgi:hypothetical protein
LKAGCPQQVWADGKSTRTPDRFKTLTIASPICGKKESIKQVMKSWTVSAMRSPGKLYFTNCVKGHTIIKYFGMIIGLEGLNDDCFSH